MFEKSVALVFIAVALTVGGCVARSVSRSGANPSYSSLGVEDRKTLAEVGTMPFDDIVNAANAGVSVRIDRGGAYNPASDWRAVDVFGVALESRDAGLIASDAWPRWPEIRSLVSESISHRVSTGELSVEAGEALRENRDRFGDYLARVARLGRLGY